MGYAFFYFTRKSFNYVTPSLIGDLDFEKSDIGIIGMLFYLIYGFSKFISGSVSDHSNPCYFMGVGLIITGIINIAFGLSSSLYAFIFLWMSNAFFRLLKKDSATALSQQFPRWLMLGSRLLVLQNRSQSSLLYCGP